MSEKGCLEPALLVSLHVVQIAHFCCVLLCTLPHGILSNRETVCNLSITGKTYTSFCSLNPSLASDLVNCAVSFIRLATSATLRIPLS